MKYFLYILSLIHFFSSVRYEKRLERLILIEAIKCEQQYSNSMQTNSQIQGKNNIVSLYLKFKFIYYFNTKIIFRWKIKKKNTYNQRRKSNRNKNKKKKKKKN